MQKTIQQTAVDCAKNFVLSAVIVLAGYCLLCWQIDDRSMVIGSLAGVSAAAAFAKGFMLRRHRFSMSVVAEIFLVAGLAFGTAVALSFSDYGFQVARYEFIILLAAFALGLAVKLVASFITWLRQHHLPFGF